MSYGTLVLVVAAGWLAVGLVLPGLADGRRGGRGLNIAYEAVDRNAGGPRASRMALRSLGRGGGVHDLTFIELWRETNRFANVLRGLGVGPGERVFLLLGRIPELYVAALGTLKHTSVVSPLFPAFGPTLDRASPTTWLPGRRDPTPLAGERRLVVSQGNKRGEGSPGGGDGVGHESEDGRRSWVDVLADGEDDPGAA